MQEYVTDTSSRTEIPPHVAWSFEFPSDVCLPSLQAFPLTFQDNLKYHLYGGTVFATVERYEEAAELLQIVSITRR